MTRPRVFLRLADPEGLDVWLDVDRIVGVRDLGNGQSLVLLPIGSDGVLLAESGDHVIDRLHRALATAEVHQ